MRGQAAAKRLIEWRKRANHNHHKTHCVFETSPLENRVGNSGPISMNKSVHFFLFLGDVALIEKHRKNDSSDEWKKAPIKERFN